MQILDIQPMPPDGRSGVRQLATFNLQITQGCRLHGLRLMQAPDGHTFVYGPQARGQRAATFTPEFGMEITREAVSAYDQFKRAA